MIEQSSRDWALDEHEWRVLCVLRQCVGKTRAITVPHLAQYLGMGRHQRQVQAIIRRLCVEHGEPILSGGAGVWMAASAEELLASYREQRRKAISTLVRQRAVYRRHLARLRGQLAMEVGQ